LAEENSLDKDNGRKEKEELTENFTTAEVFRES